MRQALLLHELMSGLDESTARGDHGYVLIDGSLWPSARKRLPMLDSGSTLCPPGSSPPAGAEWAMARLLALAGLATTARQQLLAASLEAARDGHASTWIASPLNLPSLAQALSERLDATLPDDMPVLLRFCDARVLPALDRCLSGSHRAAFFAPVSRWWHVQRNGELGCISSPSNSPQAGAGADYSMALSPQEQADLLDAAEPDVVLGLLQQQDGDALQSVEPIQRHGWCAGLISEASDWGVQSTQERALYCMMALQHGRRFSAEPMWRAGLEVVRAGKATLLDVVNSQAVA